MESSFGRRPVLFLDVDGTLLPFGPGAEPREAGSSLERLDSRLGIRLASLPAELVWATTWEDEANTEIAPRLGLPPLPVVRWPEPALAEEREDQWFGVHWKTRTLVAWADGRPFAWVDDEIADGDREWVLARHPGRALLHRVEPGRGLTEEDFAVVSDWLSAL